jgi:hypothetical protein
MCMGGGSSPAAPAKIPEAPVTPEPTGKGMSDAERRRRAAGGEGAAGTILTGPRGIEAGAGAPTGAKTLLGQ